MNTGLNDLEKQICEWQAVTFPESSPVSIFAHMVREFDELMVTFDAVPLYIENTQKHKDLANELADIFILSVALASHLGFNLTEAIAEKMKVNYTREWGKPDEQGVIEHVRDSE